MRAAAHPTQRPPDARLLVVAGGGTIRHVARTELPYYLQRGDVLVANDAATIPASLAGIHAPTGIPIEVRLAGRRSLAPHDTQRFTAIVFGPGDYRTPTEHRLAPPMLVAGDRLSLGPLRARVDRVLDHPRLVDIRFEGEPAEIWAGIANHGRPIQYAHLRAALATWDVWTQIASVPAAFEPPSAGFVIDWHLLSVLRNRGVAFATLTHAAGISSTGDPALDARLPFDEPYHIPAATVATIQRAKAAGHRVIALGTTVTRALEGAAATHGAIRAGNGVATLRIDGTTPLRVVDGIITGVHESGTSHYDLLHAFVRGDSLRRVTEALETHGYRTHEFGDTVFIETEPSRRRSDGPIPRLVHAPVELERAVSL